MCNRAKIAVVFASVLWTGELVALLCAVLSAVGNAGTEGEGCWKPVAADFSRASSIMKYRRLQAHLTEEIGGFG